MKTLILVPIVLLSACTAIVGHTKSVTYNYVDSKIEALQEQADIYCYETNQSVKSFIVKSGINESKTITFICGD